jgi:hypothetical protein
MTVYSLPFSWAAVCLVNRISPVVFVDLSRHNRLAASINVCAREAAIKVQEEINKAPRVTKLDVLRIKAFAIFFAVQS